MLSCAAGGKLLHLMCTELAIATNLVLILIVQTKGGKNLPLNLQIYKLVQHHHPPDIITSDLNYSLLDNILITVHL